MNVVVYIRPTPSWDKLRFNLDTGTVELPPDTVVGVSAFAEGVWTLSPSDRAAVEWSVVSGQWSEDGGQAAVDSSLQAGQPKIGVTAVALETDVQGAAEEVLREAMARGADRAVLISGAEEADSFVAASALAALVRRMSGKDGVDLVLLGAEAPNGAPDEVGPMLAEELGWAGVVGARTVEASTPAVVSLLPDTDLPPQYAKGGSVIAAYRKKQIETLSLDDLGLTGADAEKGSARVIVRRAALAEAPPRELLKDSVEESVAVLVQALRQMGY
ncbi:MAG: electron transfer flavoprotein subunit beta/FixA family protein [Chloroflexia bacterium]